MSSLDLESRHILLSEIPARSQPLPSLNQPNPSGITVGARADNVVLLMPSDMEEPPLSDFSDLSSELWLTVNDKWVCIEVKTSTTIAASNKQVFATIRACVSNIG
jgi:hypothetical protein